MIAEVKDIQKKEVGWMNIIEEAKELFGEMRDITPEEQKRINNYIRDISIPTGVNVFYLVNNKEPMVDEFNTYRDRIIKKIHLYEDVLRGWYKETNGAPIWRRNKLYFKRKLRVMKRVLKTTKRRRY